MNNAATPRKRNYLASEPNYHTTKISIKHFLAIEMKKQNKTTTTTTTTKTKTEILMNKPV